MKEQKRFTRLDVILATTVIGCIGVVLGMVLGAQALHFNSNVDNTDLEKQVQQLAASLGHTKVIETSCKSYDDDSYAACIIRYKEPTGNLKAMVLVFDCANCEQPEEGATNVPKNIP